MGFTTIHWPHFKEWGRVVVAVVVAKSRPSHERANQLPNHLPNQLQNQLPWLALVDLEQMFLLGKNGKRKQQQPRKRNNDNWKRKRKERNRKWKWKWRRKWKRMLNYHSQWTSHREDATRSTH